MPRLNQIPGEVFAAQLRKVKRSSRLHHK
jgi:hypothetical protein